ncbi:Uncharacterized protein TCM_020875 [Theobroma cacao]|uniref:Uncharacterized protein n=1 Tax=Theobroma cacao TaxID=3641 RepID=A0A061EMW8_THECC|nr:Uncharacterized protein TCM_020875 [Theobroma cacao]
MAASCSCSSPQKQATDFPITMSKAYLLLFLLGVMALLTTPSPSLAYNGPPEEDERFPERKPPILPGYVPPKFIPGDKPLPPKKEEPPIRPGDNKPVPQRHLSEDGGVEELHSSPCKPFDKPPKGKGKKPPHDGHHPAGHLLAEQVLENKEVLQPPRKLRPPVPPHEPPHEPPLGPPDQPPVGPPHDEPPHQPPDQPPVGPPHDEPPHQPPDQPPVGPPHDEPPHKPPRQAN